MCTVCYPRCDCGESTEVRYAIHDITVESTEGVLWCKSVRYAIHGITVESTEGVLWYKCVRYAIHNMTVKRVRRVCYGVAV